MATIPLNLFVRFKPGDPVDATHNRLMFDKNGGAPYIPPLNPGDTIALKIYYYEDAGKKSSFYPGAITTVRLRAQGNNHIYATADSHSEVAPPVNTVTVSRLQAGPSVPEIQKITFTGTPVSGNFYLVFNMPSSVGSGATDRAHFFAVVGPLSIPFTATSIHSALYAQDASPYWSHYNGFGTKVWGPGTYGAFNDWQGPVTTPNPKHIHVTGSLAQGFTFQFNYDWVSPIPLMDVDASAINWAENPGYYNADLLLTAPDFIDLFDPANGPAYIEVLINNGFVAQHLLPATSSPNAPVANFTSDIMEVNIGGTIHFTDTSTKTPTSWLWDFGDGESSALQNPAHQFNVAGTYSVKLTVSNATASSQVIKSGFAVIQPGGGGGGGGGGGSGIIGGISDVYYDVGNLTAAYAIEDVRVSTGIPNDRFSLVYRQRYAQFRANWQPLGRGEKNCPHDSNAICVNEEQPEDIGGLIRVWERVWAVVPANRTERGAYNKILKQMKVLANGTVADLSSAVIISRVASVQADYEYRYYNTAAQAPPALPDTPDLAIVRVGNFIWVEPYGGFNPNQYGGPNFGGDNYARVFLAGDTRPYMGYIVEQLRIYG